MTINKRLTALSIILTLLMVVFMPGTAGAGQKSNCFTVAMNGASEGGGKLLFNDAVGLLNADEAQVLAERLQEISEKHSFDTVIAIVPALDGKEAVQYATDYFAENGFGYGDGLDGAILLLATQDRDFGFAAFGVGTEVFTPEGQAYLDELVLPELKEDQYFKAFMTYAEAVDDFMLQAAAGTPYVAGNIPVTTEERGKSRTYAIAGSLLLALLIAFIVTFRWRGQLHSVHSEGAARNYIRTNSLQLTVQKDTFLYQRLEKHKRTDNDSKKGGTFTSSSGGSATGHSGKY